MIFIIYILFYFIFFFFFFSFYYKGYAEHYILKTAPSSQLFAHQIIWNMKANMFNEETDGSLTVSFFFFFFFFFIFVFLFFKINN